MWVVICVLFISSGIWAREFTDEEYSQIPPLFHLDDYKRCLSQSDGLYCLGTFHITPEVFPHKQYELIKQYSELPFKFNRTLIRRGYCVSARCPSAERNASLRFEHCATQWGHSRSLRTKLHTLHYCRTHRDIQKKHIPSTSQNIFIKIIYLLMLLNIVGTIYDVMTGDNPQKNKLMVAWSIPTNWRRLTAIYTGGDPRLSALNPLQGFRIMALSITMYAHANILQFRYYSANPEHLENVSFRGDGVLLSNGTSLVHVFITVSAFLTAYNLLLFSEKQALSLHMLPYCIVKRVIRLTPIWLLVIGYAATWWPHSRDGPLISPVIGRESEICRKKYWAHAFYINNIVDIEDTCLAPTWFVAVDMHLYILTCFLTLSGWLRSHALTVYPALFVASCLFNAYITYIQDYKSAVYITTPENVRKMFHGLPSYTHFYNSTWGALPACFIGLFMAHLHYELQKKKFNGGDHKWLVFFHNIAHPLAITWALMGSYVRNITSPLFTAAYVGIDRPVFVIIVTIMLFGMINMKSRLSSFYAWTGWHAMARMSLSVMLINWCVSMTIAARPYTYGTSVLDTIIDWVATCFITYVLAVPLTVLVEIPMQKFLNVLFF